MGIFRKKKEPEEVECKTELDEEEHEYKESAPEPKVVQQLVPIEFALNDKLAELDERIKKIASKVDELLRLAKD